MYKIIAFVGVVLAGVFVAPMAASAVPYTPGAVISANPVHLHPGGTSVISAGSGYFGPSEHVDVSVAPGGTTTGIHTNSVSNGWTVPDTLTSTSSGAASFSLTAPAGSNGTYTVTLTSASASGSVVLDVTSTSGGSGSNPGGGDGSGTIATTGTGGLAFTGISLPMMLIWAIAAIIALGVALITVRKMKLREKISH